MMTHHHCGMAPLEIHRRSQFVCIRPQNCRAGKMVRDRIRGSMIHNRHLPAQGDRAGGDWDGVRAGPANQEVRPRAEVLQE
jgi:hypothetical protein